MKILNDHGGITRRNPVFALEMIQTLEQFKHGTGKPVGRNPVFALEMIQTGGAFADFGCNP